MKTYTKTHTSRKAATTHLEKIKNRGGVGVMKLEKRGCKIDYSFLPKLSKTKFIHTNESMSITKKYQAEWKEKKLYDVLDPEGKSIRKPGVPLFKTLKASREYFDQWRDSFHRTGYWSPLKGSIIANNLKRHCKWIVLK